ncbi:MAG: DUF5693 family protein [Clostridiales bacterium]|jgi:hypothetical protein|nr:DUF5693 family protein [Eubacteriales bacterium]MDH7566753.1 DUF5693 family protein [Clostridiales bacterium]
MQNGLKQVLWLSLAISLLLVATGPKIRLINEYLNRSVIPVADYGEFAAAVGTSGADMENVLEQLKSSGVLTMAVREAAPGAGFDEKVLRKLKSMGFGILLRPGGTPCADADGFAGYDRLIDEFKIRYLIFDGPDAPGENGNLSRMADLIKKHHMILGIIESPSQVGYVPQKGLDKLILSTDYAINRAYIIPDWDLLSLDKEDMFFRWARAVVDRGIRFIYIRPLKNKQQTDFKNMSDTLEASKAFTGFISGKGYEINAPLTKLSSASPGVSGSLFLLLSLWAALFLYLTYLLDLKKEWVIKPAAACILLSILLTLLDGKAPMVLPKFLGLFAALLYPSLSSLLVLKYLKGGREHGLFKKVTLSLGIMLGVDLLGAYTVCAAFSHLRFLMGLESFDGVVTALLLPLALFTINYYFIFKGCRNIKNIWHGFLTTAKTPGTIFLLVLGAAVLYLYIGRSGNNYGVPVSLPEQVIRKALEKTLVARPRFKEFLIGYPCLFAFIYLYHRKGEKSILLLPGMGWVIGSISILNSFCHVFTPVSVSLHRTLNGLALGVASGGLLLVALSLILRFVHPRIKGFIKQVPGH